MLEGFRSSYTQEYLQVYMYFSFSGTINVSYRVRMYAAIFFVAFSVFLISMPQVIHAQSAGSAVESRRAQLQGELDNLEQQIGTYETLIKSKQQEASSLERDIAIINAQIAKAKLEIKRKDLAISQLSGTIQVKTKTIQSLGEKIERERSSLGESLRKLNEYDDMPLAEIMLGYEELSDFFSEVETIDSLQLAIQISSSELQDHAQAESKAKDELEERKEEEAKLRALQLMEKQLQERKEAEKKTVLKVTRGKESEYKKVADEKKKRAASIRSELFLLQGSPAIPFEKALEYAQFASQKTGVRAAFVLGIVAQESELGKNIGQCNLPDDPPQYKWDQVMHKRDHEPFKAVVAELGLDIGKMPVSCPMRGADGKRVGWGGAMGPAQFIPSTWVLYKKQISAITGANPPSPWQPKDAFVASALLLADNGAVSDEKQAAAKYFAGSNWNSYLGRSYANQVLAKVDKYQEQIAFLQSLAQR